MESSSSWKVENRCHCHFFVSSNDLFLTHLSLLVRDSLVLMSLLISFRFVLGPLHKMKAEQLMKKPPQRFDEKKEQPDSRTDDWSFFVVVDSLPLSYHFKGKSWNGKKSYTKNNCLYFLPCGEVWCSRLNKFENERIPLELARHKFADFNWMSTPYDGLQDSRKHLIHRKAKYAAVSSRSLEIKYYGFSYIACAKTI